MNPFKKFLENKGITENDFKAKSVEEKATLYTDYQEVSIKAMEATITEKTSKEDVTALIDAAVKSITGYAKENELQQMKTALEEQGEELTKLKNAGGATPKTASFQAQLEKALTEALPQLKELKNKEENKGKEVVLTIKAPVNMTTGAVANAGGVTTPDSVVYQEGLDYASDVRADAYIINFMDNGNTDKAALPYMDKLPTEGTMAITPEGTLKPLISVSFELRYSQAKKIAGRTKVSEESLDDIPNLMAIINNELRYEHDIAEQAFIFSTINTVAGAFVAGNMAASTDAPSNYDAIRASIYAVKIASKGRYIPNAALVPSSDVYNMGATKDANNNYVLPAFVMPDGTSVSGVRIVEINDDTVAEGSFVVGDFRKLKRRVYKSFTIRIGQGILGSATAADIVSDFEANMYTILGESRQHLFIYENEKVAFIKSTFAAVKTAIATV